MICGKYFKAMTKDFLWNRMKLSLLTGVVFMITCDLFAQINPYFKLVGNGIEIVNGSTTTSFADGTNFGSVNISSGSRYRNFVIENTGETEIRWSTFTLGGADASSFILQPPPSKTVPPLYYQAYTVTFDPSTVGTKNATITIVLNDEYSSTYVFAISGEAFVPADIYLIGSDYPSEANGIYNYQGLLNEFQYWKHATENYFIYNGTYGGQRYWYIDNDLTSVTLDDYLFRISSEKADPVDLSSWSPGFYGSGDPVIGYYDPETATTIVTTATASSITTSSATLGGDVSAPWYDTVTERGIIISSTNNNPAIDDEDISKHIYSTPSTGTYSINVSSLSVATHYYFRAYAINGEGTSYGEVKEFYTLNTVSFISNEEFFVSNVDTVSWKVSFAGDETGLTASNFLLFNYGLIGSHITEVSGSGKEWTVKAFNGSGSGYLLVMFDNDNGLTPAIYDLPVGSEEYHIDKIKPLLVSTYPAANATAAYPGDNIVLTLNENIVVGTGNISLFNSDGSLLEVIPVTGPRVSCFASNVTINPVSLFKKGAGYYAKVDSAAFKDQYGNSFDGITDSLTLNFNIVDVVINEVVTEPQLDWSANGFDGTAVAGSSPGSDDEWLELFIKTDSINFAGWTLELLDGTDVIGDLSTTGAFAVSKYTGAGSFSRTVAGDYLVLGNVAGFGGHQQHYYHKTEGPVRQPDRFCIIRILSFVKFIRHLQRIGSTDAERNGNKREQRLDPGSRQHG